MLALLFLLFFSPNIKSSEIMDPSKENMRKKIVTFPGKIQQPQTDETSIPVPICYLNIPINLYISFFQMSCSYLPCQQNPHNASKEKDQSVDKRNQKSFESKDIGIVYIQIGAGSHINHIKSIMLKKEKEKIEQ